MAKYKIDEQLEEEVKSYMKVVISKLKENGKIDESWNSALYLMADNYNTVIICNKQLAIDGLTTVSPRNGVTAHPMVKIKNDAQKELQKLLIEFGFTLKSGQKMGVETEQEELTPFMAMMAKNKVEKR